MVKSHLYISTIVRPSSPVLVLCPFGMVLLQGLVGVEEMPWCHVYSPSRRALGYPWVQNGFRYGGRSSAKV